MAIAKPVQSNPFAGPRIDNFQQHLGEFWNHELHVLAPLFREFDHPVLQERQELNVKAADRKTLDPERPGRERSARALQFDVDYKRLLEAFQTKGRLLRASYFTPLADTDDHVAIRPLVDWMQYNGWNVVTKPAKVF